MIVISECFRSHSSRPTLPSLGFLKWRCRLGRKRKSWFSRSSQPTPPWHHTLVSCRQNERFDFYRDALHERADKPLLDRRRSNRPAGARHFPLVVGEASRPISRGPHSGGVRRQLA